MDKTVKDQEVLWPGITTSAHMDTCSGESQFNNTILYLYFGPIGYCVLQCKLLTFNTFKNYNQLSQHKKKTKFANTNDLFSSA